MRNAGGYWEKAGEKDQELNEEEKSLVLQVELE